MVKLKIKDIIILSISVISAATLLIYGNISIAGVIGMSVTILSVIFIIFVSEGLEFKVSENLKNKLKKMTDSQREDYLKNKGLLERKLMKYCN